MQNKNGKKEITIEDIKVEFEPSFVSFWNKFLHVDSFNEWLDSIERR